MILETSQEGHAGCCEALKLLSFDRAFTRLGAYLALGGAGATRVPRRRL